MQIGEVYRFNYLWGHEAQEGRVSGRKIRRVCLAVQAQDWLFLFPITSLEPESDRLYAKVPPIEARRVGLKSDKQSYLILDDFNRVRPNELYDFESLTPEGSFSSIFVTELARRFREAVWEKRPIVGLTRR